jgi:hypothetical protein
MTCTGHWADVIDPAKRFKGRMNLYGIKYNGFRLSSLPITHISALKSGKRLKYSPLGQKQSSREPKIISIQPGSGEEWKAASVAEMLQNGAVSR